MYILIWICFIYCLFSFIRFVVFVYRLVNEVDQNVKDPRADIRKRERGDSLRDGSSQHGPGANTRSGTGEPSPQKVTRLYILIVSVHLCR